MSRSTADLYTLMTRGPDGLYPYAGIPWFSTMFGRDGIITAMMLLWADPAVARGVLLQLARTQAVASDPVADAQPGKILHERRSGEMANLGEVPFGFYIVRWTRRHSSSCWRGSISIAPAISP